MMIFYWYQMISSNPFFIHFIHLSLSFLSSQLLSFVIDIFRIFPRKLSNPSPSINRSPSNQDSASMGQRSIQRTHTNNQTRYIDTKEKWSNFPTEPSPSPSPYFPDRPGRYGQSNKATNFDMENLITSSCATSLTSSGSSLTNHSNKAQTKPRNFRFSFRTEVTSKKSPEELMAEIKRVLVAFHIDYEQRSNFVLFCTYGESSGEAVIQWEIEVCQFIDFILYHSVLV